MKIAGGGGRLRQLAGLTSLERQLLESLLELAEGEDKPQPGRVAELLSGVQRAAQAEVMRVLLLPDGGAGPALRSGCEKCGRLDEIAYQLANLLACAAESPIQGWI